MGRIKGKQYKVFIYVLIDPRYDTVRYVGVTVDPKGRMSAHLRDTQDCHRVRWIKSVLRDGYKPTMNLIDETDETMWEERERWWIKYYRDSGCNLTNSTDGGDGLLNASPETRAKLREYRIGTTLPEETKTKIGLAGIGRHPTEETLGKLSAWQKGKPKSDTHRANISKAKTGTKRSPESCQKQSQSVTGEGNPNFGKPRPESVKEQLRVANIGKTLLQETRDKIGNSLFLRSVLKKDNTSGYRWVSWHKVSQKWMAMIEFRKKKKYLGLYDDKEEAHEVAERAYNELLEEYNLSRYSGES